MKIIQIPSQLVGITPLKDGSMNLRFYTQEMTAKEKLIVLEYFQKFGWLLFKEDEKDFDEIDVPKEKSGMKEEKTPQQRLRARMFVYYKETKKTKDGFYDWYTKVLERIGQNYLDKI